MHKISILHRRLACKKQESPERNAHFKKFELSDKENLSLIKMVKKVVLFQWLRYGIWTC